MGEVHETEPGDCGQFLGLKIRYWGGEECCCKTSNGTLLLVFCCVVEEMITVVCGDDVEVCEVCECLKYWFYTLNVVL